MIEKMLIVSAGGALGAGLRFICVTWVGRAAGDLALGTLFVNVVGSFLMGVLAVAILERGPDTAARLAPFLLTGILGGFTTFSAFSLDAFKLYDDGRILAALSYVGGSVLLSILGLAVGLLLARSAMA